MIPSFEQLDDARKRIAYQRVAQKVVETRANAQAALASLQKEIAKRARLVQLAKSIPPALQCMLSPARYKGAHGGRGSSKSESYGRVLIHRAVKSPGLRAVCVREVQKSLEQSVKRLLEDIIVMYGYESEFRVLNTHIETPGNGIIIFQGMQNHTADSIKSLQGYDIAWVEEAQSLSARSLELLRPTLRKEGSEMWFSWNPEKEDDPVDEFLRGKDGPPPESIVREVNFKDNPFLPQVLRNELEYDRGRDIDKYNHTWLGKYRKLSASRVFRNWTVRDFDTKKDAFFLFGGDWGFSVDPSVLVRGYVEGNTLYVDQEAWSVQCEIDDTPALFDSVGCTKNHQHSPLRIGEKGHVIGSLSKAPVGTGTEDYCNGQSRQWSITADSARPETISYMQRHNYPRIEGARKGPGSIEEGVKFLQSYDIVVHTRCENVISELSSYSYKVDPLTEKITPILQDKKNHTIDSLRYMVESLRLAQKPRAEVW